VADKKQACTVASVCVANTMRNVAGKSFQWKPRYSREVSLFK